jgi:release factor glutamine methyltransferase
VLLIAATLRAAGCVFAEEEARLLVGEASTPAELEAMVKQRTAGLPLEHVLGWAQFCGLKIAVDRRVFVPRRRTEFLARQAATLATSLTERTTDRPPIIVELCCGSGAVGATLAATLDRIELHAADIEPAAVRCARRNLSNATVYEGDLYDPLPLPLRDRVDVLIANAPYVPTDAIDLMPPEARLHEPRVALDGGADGLRVLRRVIAGAFDWLAPGGSLMVETGRRQAALAVETFTQSGLFPQVSSSDEWDATVVIGTKPSRSTTFSLAPHFT